MAKFILEIPDGKTNCSDCPFVEEIYYHTGERDVMINSKMCVNFECGKLDLTKMIIKEYD